MKKKIISPIHCSQRDLATSLALSIACHHAPNQFGPGRLTVPVGCIEKLHTATEWMHTDASAEPYSPGEHGARLEAVEKLSALV
jgi:hypothetical protein